MQRVCLPALTIPSSDFVSPEFMTAYAKHAAFVWAFNNRDRPAPNAPAAEWDKYDAESDRDYAEPILAWDLEHYPVNVIDTNIAGVRVGLVSPKSGADDRRLLVWSATRAINARHHEGTLHSGG
jgi:hypothetical protein